MPSIRQLYGIDNAQSNTKILRVKDLLKYDESVYMFFLTLFCAKPFDVITMLYEEDIREDSISHYELFVKLYEKYSTFDSLMQFIAEYFKVESIKTVKLKDKTLFVDPLTAKIIVCEENFKYISEQIRDMSGYTNKKQEKFANELTREFFIENLIEELEDDNKEYQSNYGNLLTAIVTMTNYSFKTVLDITLYQFHSLIKTIKKRDEFLNIMSGIYNGTVDAEKVGIDKYNWLIDDNKEE